MHEITPCLWFDTQGLEAAEYYVSVFPNSTIDHVAYYGEGGPRDAGTVMAVAFTLDGRKFSALNGGPQFAFSEAVSFQVFCDDQEQIDHFQEKLSDGGEEGPCGWVRDRFGLSWQVVPRRLIELLDNSDPDVARRAMTAMMGMRKIVIAEIEAAVAVA